MVGRLNPNWRNASNFFSGILSGAHGGTGASKFNKVSVNLNGSSQTGNTSGVFVKVNFSHAVEDPDGVFDVTTNHRYQPNVAGTFLVCASISITNNVDGTALIASLFKNGNEFFRGGQQNSGSANPGGCEIAALVSMNGSTDYLEIFGFQNSGGNQSYDGTITLTWMTAQRVGP